MVRSSLKWNRILEYFNIKLNSRSSAKKRVKGSANEGNSQGTKMKVTVPEYQRLESQILALNTQNAKLKEENQLLLLSQARSDREILDLKEQLAQTKCCLKNSLESK